MCSHQILILRLQGFLHGIVKKYEWYIYKGILLKISIVFRLIFREDIFFLVKIKQCRSNEALKKGLQYRTVLNVWLLFRSTLFPRCNFAIIFVSYKPKIIEKFVLVTVRMYRL